jgi:hypothetical protein
VSENGSLTDSFVRRLIPSARALDAVEIGTRARVQTVNLHHLALARTDPAFRNRSRVSQGDRICRFRYRGRLASRRNASSKRS